MMQPQTQQPAAPAGQAQGQKTPDPQTLEAYQRLGIAVIKVVYNAEASKGLVQMMQQSADPAAGVAMAATFVLDKLRKDSPPQMQGFVNDMMPAAIIEAVKLGEAAGLFKADAELVKSATQALGEHLKSGAQPQQGAQPRAAPEAAPAPQGGLLGSARQPMSQPMMGA